MTPRALVGVVILALCGLMLTGFMIFLPVYSTGWNLFRFGLVAALALVGTQVLWGRPLPGSGGRTRGRIPS
jgi:hypothetical protein